VVSSREVLSKIVKDDQLITRLGGTVNFSVEDYIKKEFKDN